ncbi:MAG: hypothetical protein OXD50_04500 [Chloroflexi bacterium]|nr:hypothetical protein [Chloroflexota bacterium]
MYPTLLADAFGRLIPTPERVAPDPDDPSDNELDGYLWGAFRTRSVLMGWSARVDGETTSRLWKVEEAELTYHKEPQRIGFAQVGLGVNPPTYADVPDNPPPPGWARSQAVPAALPRLDDGGPPTDPAVAVPPLIQCLDDSIRWFGEAEVWSYQVTGYDLPPRNAERTGSVLGWFQDPIEANATSAILTMASSQGGDPLVSEVFNLILGWGHDLFTIGPLVNAPEGVAAGLDWQWLQELTRGEVGMAVTMPEWSTAAAGWPIEAELSLEPAPHSLSVRVSRTAPEGTAGR